jgi:hypothetical protein
MQRLRMPQDNNANVNSLMKISISEKYRHKQSSIHGQIMEPIILQFDQISEKNECTEVPEASESYFPVYWSQDPSATNRTKEELWKQTTAATLCPKWKRPGPRAS